MPKSKDSKPRSEALKTDWVRIDAMTDEEVEAAALADPDAQPVPKEWFERAAARQRAKKTAAE